MELIFTIIQKKDDCATIEVFKQYFDELLSEGIIQRGDKDSYFVADNVTDVNISNLLNETSSTKEKTQQNEIINLLKDQVAFLKSEINQKNGIISHLISKIPIPLRRTDLSGVIKIWRYHSDAISKGRK